MGIRQITLSLGNSRVFASYLDDEDAGTVKYIGPHEGYRNAIWFNGKDQYFGEVALQKALAINYEKYEKDILKEFCKPSEQRKKYEYNGMEFHPKGMLALILSDIKKQICKELGVLDEDCWLKVLLVVPQYAMAFLKDIKAACYIARIRIVSVLPEPYAICIAYRINPERKKKVLVVDLGSTFKIDYIEGTGKEYKTLASYVNAQFSVSDLRNRMKNYIAEKIESESGRSIDYAADEDQVDFKEKIEKTFKELIETEKESIEVEFNYPGFYKGRIKLYKEESEGERFEDSFDQDKFNIYKRLKSEISSMGSMILDFLKKNQIQAMNVDELLYQGTVIRLKPITEMIEKLLNGMKPTQIPKRSYLPEKLPAIGGSLYYQGKGERLLEEEEMLSEEDRVLIDIINSISSVRNKEKTSMASSFSPIIKQKKTIIAEKGSKISLSKESINQLHFVINDATCGIRMVSRGKEPAGIIQDNNAGIHLTTAQLEKITQDLSDQKEVRIVAYTKDKKSISEKSFIADVWSNEHTGNDMPWLRYTNIVGTGGKTNAINLFRLYKYKEEWKIEIVADIEGYPEIELIIEPRSKTKTAPPVVTANIIQLGSKLIINEAESKSIKLSTDLNEIELCAVAYDGDCRIRSSIGRNVREIKEKMVKWMDNTLEIDIKELKGQEQISAIGVIARSNEKIEIGRKRYSFIIQDQQKEIGRYKNEACFNCTEAILQIARIYKHKDQIKIAITVDEKLDQNAIKAAHMAFDGIAADTAQEKKQVQEHNTLELGTRLELTKDLETLEIHVDDKTVHLLDDEYDKSGGKIKKGHVQRIKKSNGIAIKIKEMIADNNTKEIKLRVTSSDEIKVHQKDFPVRIIFGEKTSYLYKNSSHIANTPEQKKFEKIFLFHIYEKNGKWSLKLIGDLE